MMKKSIGFVGERFVHIQQKHLEEIKYSSLMDDLYIHSIGYYNKAENHYVKREHGCGQYILLYCTTGKGFVEMNGEKYTLCENRFIIIPSNTPHAYRADTKDPWSIYWIHFMGNNAEYFAETFCYPFQIEETENSRIENRLNLFEEIYFTLNTGDDLAHLHYANCCFVYFMATLRYINIYRKIESRQKKSYGDRMIDRLTHYMNENIEKQLTNPDFAAFVGYSESYLYRRFYKETGMAPKHYFQSLKIKKSCVLLAETNLSVKDISLKLGFNDPYYFSKLFRQITEMSPTEYRKRHSIVSHW